VLGFGLLLFVGILVSDHFSASQRRVSTVLAAKTPMRQAREAEPVTIQPVQFQDPRTIGRVEPIVVGPQAGQTPQVAVPQGVPAERYTLKEGETLYKLCQNRYGNGNLWKELAEFNKGTISNPTRLKKGMTIRLPSINVLRGEVPAPIAQAPQLAPQASLPSSPALIPAPGVVAQPTLPAPAAEREYIVQKGDTLGAIASREMGSAKKWNQLFEANKDRLKSPTDLKIGKALRIPAAE
jgi:nucleoid-associated protein YgaU